MQKQLKEQIYYISTWKLFLIKLLQKFSMVHILISYPLQKTFKLVKNIASGGGTRNSDIFNFKF